jgi:hypothetical protein
LPCTLEYILLKGNPCSYLPDYRLQLLTSLNLYEIDEKPISDFEKRLAHGQVYQDIKQESTLEDLNVTESIDEQGLDCEKTKLDDDDDDKDLDQLYKNTFQNILNRSKERRSQIQVSKVFSSLTAQLKK